MTTPENIKQILLSEIEKMDLHRADFCRHPGIDFTRNRKFSFDKLIHFPISMESSSINHELLKYFNFDVETPSLSAFYQQRAKLSDEVFQHLFPTSITASNLNPCSKADTSSLPVTDQPLLLQEIQRIQKAIMIQVDALQRAITKYTSYPCLTC